MLMEMRLNKKFVVLVVASGMLLPFFFFMVSQYYSPLRGVKLTHREQNYQGSHDIRTHSNQEGSLSTHSQQTGLAEHVWRVCNKWKRRKSSRWTKPFDPRHYNHILVDDKFKVLYCYIPKIACTNWRRVLLGLSGKVKVKSILDISSSDVHVRYKRLLPVLSNFNQSEIEYRLDKYYKFMFVREPFERLLSAWRNKFLSNSSSSLYFRKLFGATIIKRYRKPGQNYSVTELKRPEVMKLNFDEFLQYVVDPLRQEPLNEHWNKYHQLCRPCSVHYDFVGKYETIDEDAEHVLKAIHADLLVQFPTRSASYKHNSTSLWVDNYYKDLPPLLLRNVYKSYFADFELFNYSVPRELKTRLDFDADDIVSGGDS